MFVGVVWQRSEEGSEWQDTVREGKVSGANNSLFSRQFSVFLEVEGGCGRKDNWTILIRIVSCKKPSMLPRACVYHMPNSQIKSNGKYWNYNIISSTKIVLNIF